MTALVRLPSAGSAADPLLLDLVEEILAKLQAGEPVDLDAYLREYPAQAEGLERLVPTVQVMAELGRASAAGAAATAESRADELAGVLGDFRIVREVGRGGMGIVYEAEQLSLQRRVALKVLPFAATLDPRHLQRFQNEARAAACLHHEHIVPVYAVGNDRGVHHFAMQFIDGQTLADFLKKQSQGGAANQPTGPDTPPSPDAGAATADTAVEAAATSTPPPSDGAYFRRVAEWGIDAALALEYAHSLGIVHRDIKPANLMLDERGQLWVTDFGLARTTAESGLTMTGDVLGTLRYMSPEQALARHGLVDHRTDIYALGVTLYELLTLRPAIGGQDRREILSRIADEEPVSPRKLNRAIPADLETVVLKAIHKEPQGRYATARELADDLRRVLLHEPIRAKKPTWAQHAGKWSRRHPAAMRWAMFLLVLLTAGSLLSTWLIWQEKARTAFALAAEVAERNRADEEKRIARERDEETTAVLEFVESKIFAAARPEGRAGGLGHEVKLRQALEAALPSVARSLSDKPLIEARLRRTLGLSFQYLGEEKIAAEQFEAARTLYTKHRGPDHPDTLASMNNLANSYAALGRHADALQLRQETLALRRDKLGPDHKDTLASMHNLATSYDALGRHAEALTLREQTLDLRRAKFGTDNPDTLDSMNNLAISYTMLGRHAEAVKLREVTLALQKARDVPDYPRLLASMHNLAQSYHALGRHADALQLYEETLALAEAKLPKNHPKTLLIMNNLAWLLATAEDVQFRDPARAVELAAKAAQLAPNNGDFSGTLGVARYRTGDWQQAALDLEKAISLRSPEDSVNANESFFLAMARWQIGDKPGARQWFDKGLAWMDKDKSRVDEVARFRAEAAELLGLLDEAKNPDLQTPK
jgi:serine/threonine protein kinase/Flp pilus assembly protein TadD